MSMKNHYSRVKESLSTLIRLLRQESAPFGKDAISENLTVAHSTGHFWKKTKARKNFNREIIMQYLLSKVNNKNRKVRMRYGYHNHNRNMSTNAWEELRKKKR